MCRDIERWEVNEVQIPGKKIEPQWPFLDTLVLGIVMIDHPVLDKAAELYAMLRASGQLIEDADQRRHDK
jgi:hypothetical protein